MFSNIWNGIVGWFSDVSQRYKLVRSFNEAARNAFVSGYAPAMLKASVSKGERSYRHPFSDWMYTGFRIEVYTGRELSKEELLLIGMAILNDSVLVRRLVVLGWDTLEVHGDRGRYGLRWQLKTHMELHE
jgi:hypothetical protein